MPKNQEHEQVRASGGAISTLFACDLYGLSLLLNPTSTLSKELEGELHAIKMVAQTTKRRGGRIVPKSSCIG